MLQLALDAVQDAMFEEMDRLDNETLTPEETFATKLNLVQLEKNEMALFAALDEMEGKMAVPYIAPREQPSESSTNKFNLHP